MTAPEVGPHSAGAAATKVGTCRYCCGTYLALGLLSTALQSCPHQDLETSPQPQHQNPPTFFLSPSRPALYGGITVLKMEPLSRISTLLEKGQFEVIPSSYLASKTLT